MIRESGRIVKRSGEKIWGALEFLGGIGVAALGAVFRRIVVWKDEIYESRRAPPAVLGTSSDSPLANVGPVPDALREDPFPGDSVPWSIQEAEKERGRSREMMIWKVAITISWLVTVVAALRSLGML